MTARLLAIPCAALLAAAAATQARAAATAGRGCDGKAPRVLARVKAIHSVFSAVAAGAGGTYTAVTNGEGMAEYFDRSFSGLPMWNAEAHRILERLDPATLTVERQSAVGRLSVTVSGTPRRGTRAAFFTRSWNPPDPQAAKFVPDDAFFAVLSSSSPDNPFEAAAAPAREAFEKPLRDAFPKNAFAQGATLFAAPTLHSPRDGCIACVLKIADSNAVESTLSDLPGKTFAGLFLVAPGTGARAERAARAGVRSFTITGLRETPKAAGLYGRVAALAATAAKGFALEFVAMNGYLMAEISVHGDLADRASLVKSGVAAYPFAGMAQAHSELLRKGGRLLGASCFSPAAAVRAGLSALPGVRKSEISSLPRSGAPGWNVCGIAQNGDFVWCWSISDADLEACAAIEKPARKILDAFLLRHLVDAQTALPSVGR